MRQQDSKQIISDEDVDLSSSEDQGDEEIIQYFKDSVDEPNGNQESMHINNIIKVGKAPKTQSLIQDVIEDERPQKVQEGSSLIDHQNPYNQNEEPQQNGFHTNIKTLTDKTQLEQIIAQQVKEKLQGIQCLKDQQGLGQSIIHSKPEIKQEEPFSVIQPNPSGLDNFIMLDYSKSEKFKENILNQFEPCISKGMLDSEKNNDEFKKDLLFQITESQQKHVFECDCLPVGGTSILIEVEIDVTTDEEEEDKDKDINKNNDEAKKEAQSDSDSDQELQAPKYRQVNMLAQAVKQYVVRRQRGNYKKFTNKFLKQEQVQQNLAHNLKLQKKFTEPKQTVFDENQLKGLKMKRLKKKDSRPQGGIIQKKVKKELKREID